MPVSQTLADQHRPRRTEPEVLHAAWSRSSAITTRAESAI